RPDNSIVNEAIPLFAIGRNHAGLWVARDCDGSAGDVFLTKGAAIRFARRTSGSGGGALMFAANGLELGQASARIPAGHSAIQSAIGRVTTGFNRRVRDLFERSKRNNQQKQRVESELYRSQYRYRSKSDDDLPVVL